MKTMQSALAGCLPFLVFFLFGSTVASANTVVEVNCRAQWNAAPPNPGLVPHRVERITIHHTATRQVGGEAAKKAIRSFQRLHQHHPRKSLPDIAYHYLIAADGVIYEGRDVKMRGDTHTAYDPTGHLLICLLGNFERDKPTVEQLSSLAKLTAWALDQYKLEPKTISVHRDHAATACPGKNLTKWIADGELTSKVKELRASGAWQMRVKCPK